MVSVIFDVIGGVFNIASWYQLVSGNYSYLLLIVNSATNVRWTCFQFCFVTTCNAKSSAAKTTQEVIIDPAQLH